MASCDFFLDLIFPPLCLACKEKCSTKYLCPDCWQLCSPLDPIERCRHCFELLDQKGPLCKQCKEQRLLPVMRAYVFDPESPAHFLDLEAHEAMAGFAFLQWIQLDWPTPHAVVPMPDTHSKVIGNSLSLLLNCPFVKALRADCSYREDLLEEGEILLLFDVSNSVERLQKGALALSEAFPKRIYLLSLLPE